MRSLLRAITTKGGQGLEGDNQSFNGLFAPIAVFVTNEHNPKEWMSIKPDHEVKGYKYADYLADNTITKKLFVNE